MNKPLLSLRPSSLDLRLVTRIVLALALVHVEAGALLGGGW